MFRPTLRVALAALALAAAPAAAQEPDAPARYRPKRLSDISIDLTPTPGKLPDDATASLDTGPTLSGRARRDWVPTCYCWRPSDLCHRPLAFEDAPLERYGQTAGHFAQPVVSAGRFMADSLRFPLHVIGGHTHRCETPLGHCRPGGCVRSVKQK